MDPTDTTEELFDEDLSKEHGPSGFRPEPRQTFRRPDPEEEEQTTDGEDEAEEEHVRFANSVKSSYASRRNIEVINQDEQILQFNEKDNGTNTPTVATFKDHFTLPVPSSLVRYRNSNGAARVIEGTDFQFVLEEHVNENTKEVTIRRIQETNESLRLLRLTYTIVAAFWTGFLFVFSLQVLLFLFLDLAISLGVSDRSDFKWFAAIGAIFAIIPLIHGLASAMVLAGSFVMDTWRGHYLIRNFAFRRLSSVTVEWIFFLFFLGLPIFLLCCLLLSRNDDWWAVGGLFWIGCVAAFFVVFTANVIFYEMAACMEVMKNQYDDDSDKFFEVAKRSILLRQVSTYGGRMKRSFVARGSIEDSEFTDKHGEDNLVPNTLTEKFNWRANFTMPLIKYGWFEQYPEPKRFFSVEDARDVRPFITAHTWSLEKIFCRPRNSRFIAIIRGQGAVSRAQMKSSIACSIVGSLLIFFTILAVLVYLQAGAAATGFLLAVAVLLSIPNFRSTYRLYKMGKDVIAARNESKRTDGSDHQSALQRGATEKDLESVNFSVRNRDGFNLQQNDSEGLYLVEESYRITAPSTRTAWVLFWVEVCLLFVWPTISLFAVGNWPLGLLYFVITGLSGLRYYVNAAVVMEEVGHMELVDGKSEREVWKNQSRLNEIVGNITRGRSRGAWITVISVVALAFFGLFAGALGTDQASEEIEDPSYTYLSNFEYKPLENSLRYPTCQLTSDLQESPLTSMADYIFLARVAYRGSITQSELDSWFGSEVAMDQADIVSTYRDEHDTTSQVSFKLITYPTDGGSDFAYLAIRGTTNQWEALTDAQLWSSAFLMQFLRELLPFGSIWTSVMPSLISAITAVQSKSIEEISFYKDTVDFVNFLKSGNYSGVAVSGHSLGGGLSIITGAIAHVPAVALSGPNTVLTRRSLDPPVTRNELDRYSFNIIPERDVVPKIDDPAQNYQKIRCNADYTDVIGCHDTTRALCEAIYTCGTNGRPALCECVTVMGFPEPEPLGDVTFAEACNWTSSE